MAGNAALYRSHAAKTKTVVGRPAGSVWQARSDAEGAERKREQTVRVVEQIRRHFGLSPSDLPDCLGDAVVAFLDAAPVEAPKARKPQSPSSRLRPTMRLMELSELWRQGNDPKPQSAKEYGDSARDFIDYLGDVTVAEIVNDDFLNYRDEVAKLPATMPRADRELPFTERVRKHENSGTARLSPASVKKKVGAIQALLTFAKDQRWIRKNEGRDVPINGYTKGPRRRRTFTQDQLKMLFGSTLFTAPAAWRADRGQASGITLYWLFLLALTTGARLEEMGQVAIADVKKDGSVHYLDIDDYVENEDAEEKSLKTEASRRLVPIHDRLIELGFLDYRDALAAAGHVQLFPDLVANDFGKRTKEASRVANRYIDRIVSKDPRLVFYSFRHGFKDLATEAGISERIVDQICGHTPTTVGGRYGVGVGLPALHRALHQVDWSFLDWGRLGAATASVDWAEAATGCRLGAES